MLQLIVLSLVLSLVQGMAVRPRNGASPLKLDFAVSKTVGNISASQFWAHHARLKSKRGYPETITDYRDTSYHIDVYLGSGKQRSTVSLDTGSSDLWVPPSGYSPDLSSTSHDTGLAMDIAYLDGSSNTGTYYLDTLQFDTEAPVVSNFQFALANGSNTGVFGSGILGIADRNQEAAPRQYNNLPYALEASGITPKASYSLFLGPDGGSGSVIFGGIDTEKYLGELTTYPLDRSTGGLGIQLQNVAFGGRNITVNSAVLLDSGTSLGLLTSELMEVLDGIFNTTITTQGSIQYRYTSCNQPADEYLEFDFGRNTVKISYSDAVVKQSNGQCVLGFGYYNEVMILGDVFLRQAYVYYDLTDSTVAIAQASYASSSNIVGA